MGKDKVVAIVQSRLGSTRLPLKAFLNLHGKPLIDWTLERLAMATRLDGIVVAVPDTEMDALLQKHVEAGGFRCVAGSEDDVLARLVLAAQKANAGKIVRVCADNPLVWGEAVDRLVDFYGKNSCDYAYNHIPRNNLWPDGLGAEMISRDLLDEMDKKAREKSQREHCLNYIWDNSNDYRIATFDPAEDWLKRPDLKLDVDRPADYVRLAQRPLKPQMNAREIVEIF